MKKIFFLVITLFLNFLVFSQSSNIIWKDISTKYKFIQLLGKIENKYYLVYENKEKKIIVRGYDEDLSNYNDVDINYTLKNRENFYQKSLIVNNKITHFIAEFNSEKKSIELFAYVQNNPNNPQLTKNILAENPLWENAKTWALNLDFFSKFDINLSEDKSKIYAQLADYESEILFKNGIKEINVFDCTDLSKKIKSYKYISNRSYLTKNSLDVSNQAEIVQSDSFRLITDKKNVVSQKHFLIKMFDNDEKNKSLELYSEGLAYASLKTYSDDDIYTLGFRSNHLTLNNKFFLYQLNKNDLSVKDSINIDISDFCKPSKEKSAYDYNIHSIYKNSKNQFIIVAQQYYFIRSAYVNTASDFFYGDFVIFTYDLSTNKISLNNLTNYNDKLFEITKDKFYWYSPLKTFFKNDELYVIYKDLKKKTIEIIKLDSIGNIKSNAIINEDIEKSRIGYKTSQLIDTNTLLIIDHKNDRIGLSRLF